MFIPSIATGILSAIIQTSGASSINSYKSNVNSSITNFQAGGIQMAGLGISIGLGIGGGILLGIIYRLLGYFNDKDNYFRD